MISLSYTIHRRPGLVTLGENDCYVVTNVRQKCITIKVLIIRKNTMFWKLDPFPSSDKRVEESITQYCLSERAFLNGWTPSAPVNGTALSSELSKVDSSSNFSHH
jgi:hypothetical protein